MRCGWSKTTRGRIHVVSLQATVHPTGRPNRVGKEDRQDTWSTSFNTQGKQTQCQAPGLRPQAWAMYQWGKGYVNLFLPTLRILGKYGVWVEIIVVSGEWAIQFQIQITAWSLSELWIACSMLVILLHIKTSAVIKWNNEILLFFNYWSKGISDIKHF